MAAASATPFIAGAGAVYGAAAVTEVGLAYSDATFGLNALYNKYVFIASDSLISAGIKYLPRSVVNSKIAWEGFKLAVPSIYNNYRQIGNDLKTAWDFKENIDDLIKSFFK